MTVVAVLLGGMLGTALRLAADTVLPHPTDGFPLSTLLVNVVGSFALAVLVGRVWPFAAPWVRAGLGTGVLGSFTTFSAVTVPAVELVAAGAAPLSAAYLAASLVAGLAAAAGGLALGRPRATAPRAERA